jgi:hypothetical protein
MPPVARVKRAILHSSPSRSSHTSSVEPVSHHVTNTRAHRPTRLIDIREGRSSRLGERHGTAASGGDAPTHAGSSVGAGQRAAILPTVK